MWPGYRAKPPPPPHHKLSSCTPAALVAMANSLIPVVSGAWTSSQDHLQDQMCVKEILCEDNTILWISKLCSSISVRWCFIELVWWLQSKISSSLPWPLHCKIRKGPIHKQRNFTKYTFTATNSSQTVLRQYCCLDLLKILIITIIISAYWTWQWSISVIWSPILVSLLIRPRQRW